MEAKTRICCEVYQICFVWVLPRFVSFWFYCRENNFMSELANLVWCCLELNTLKFFEYLHRHLQNKSTQKPMRLKMKTLPGYGEAFFICNKWPPDPPCGYSDENVQAVIIVLKDHDSQIFSAISQCCFTKVMFHHF